MIDGIADGWLWLIAAGLLAAAEMVVPGVYLIWIAMAAAVTGAVTLALPLTPVIELMVFIGATAASIVAGHKLVQGRHKKSSDPMLNDRSARLIGAHVVALEAVGASGGRVRVGDSVWNARGGPVRAGSGAWVVAVESGTLIVVRDDPEASSLRLP